PHKSSTPSLHDALPICNDGEKVDGQTEGPQNHNDFGSDQYLADQVDPEHATDECKVMKPIVSNGRFQFLGACKPGRGMIAKGTYQTGKDWIATHDYKDHTRK